MTGPNAFLESGKAARAQGARSATEDADVRHWTGLAYSIADGYFLPGGEFSDLRQEALIGLLLALRTWDRDKGTLGSFIRLVVEQRVVTAVKLATTRKHRMLSETTRVIVLESREEDAVELGVSNLGRDPHLVLVENEAIRDLTWRAGGLTDLERRAIGGITSGKTYCEIEGVPEGAKPKWIDNAVQRARAKLREAA